MKKEEIEFILKEGEGQFIEFKECFDSKNFAKEIVAFANSEGGRIILGVNDKGDIKGIEITNKIKSEIQDIARKCDPFIAISVETFDNVLIIHVAEGENKPYQCSQGFYLRTGANSQKLTRDEIIEFSVGEGKIKFDEQINKNFNFPEDFDDEKFGQYMEVAGLTKNIPTKEILLTLNVAKLINNKIKLNNAGALFFAKSPGKFFINSKVVCVNYRTNEKVDILDKKIFDNGIINNIEEAINYVKKHIDLKFEIKTAKRKEIPQFPEAAFREAIVNAVMHRDYFDKSGDVMIEIFRNKIWVSNPGGLVKWLKPEDFGRYSRPRNPLIAELLSKTEYVEKVGSGINRIRTAVNEAGLPEVIFEYNSSFITILNDKTGGAGEKMELSGGVCGGVSGGVDLLDYIQKNPGERTSQMIREIGMAKRTIERQLKRLRDERKIEFRGSAKTGGYYVKDEK
jgi:ATP-dependent DNA helicase RecG